MARKATQLPSGSWRIQVPLSKEWDEEKQKWKYHMGSLTAATKAEVELLAAEWEQAHNPEGIIKFTINDFNDSDHITYSKDDFKEFIASRYSNMDGLSFEHLCADILKKLGFMCKYTKRTGDHGADIMATRGTISYVVQCKYHASNVGFDAVKEAYTAKGIYGTNQAVVMTNSDFTTQAIIDASSLGVSLWNGAILAHLIESIIRG